MPPVTITTVAIHDAGSIATTIAALAAAGQLAVGFFTAPATPAVPSQPPAIQALSEPAASAATTEVEQITAPPTTQQEARAPSKPRAAPATPANKPTLTLLLPETQVAASTEDVSTRDDEAQRKTEVPVETKTVDAPESKATTSGATQRDTATPPERAVVAEAIKQLATRNREALIEILAKHGGKHLSDISAEKWAALLADLRKALA